MKSAICEVAGNMVMVYTFDRDSNGFRKRMANAFLMEAHKLEKLRHETICTAFNWSMDQNHFCRSKLHLYNALYVDEAYITDLIAQNPKGITLKKIIECSPGKRVGKIVYKIL